MTYCIIPAKNILQNIVMLFIDVKYAIVYGNTHLDTTLIIAYSLADLDT